MLNTWIGRGARPAYPPALAPGLRIYAVGDVHGRDDLLAVLHRAIRADLERSRPDRSLEIYLGDYMDRGPNSRGALDRLRGEPLCDERLCLKGNHEDILLRCLSDPSLFPYWRDAGGYETLRSFGVVPPLGRAGDALAATRDRFEQALGTARHDFIAALPLTETIDDYLFVHAGLRPGVAVNAQTEEDLLWIREPFLSSEVSFGKFVVHGHTPATDPQVRRNRINIDTGAFATGCLTCLVLEGETQRFLTARM